jgi:TRAP-type C4-dicarboxylate transport system permease small subunit
VNDTESKGTTRLLRRSTKIANLTLRAIGLTFIIAGWLGELAIMVGRNIVKVEPAWTVALATLSLVYGSLLYVGLVNRHIGFTLVNNRLARFKYASRIAPFISLVIIGALLVFSIPAVNTSYIDGGTAIQTPWFFYPNWLVVGVMPITFFLLFVQLVYKFFRPTSGPNQVSVLATSSDPAIDEIADSSATTDDSDASKRE